MGLKINRNEVIHLHSSRILSQVDWNQYCNNIDVSHFINNPVQVGGPGHTVEIDKSLFSRRKYNRGRIVPSSGFLEVMILQPRKVFCCQFHVGCRYFNVSHHTVGQAGNSIWSDMWGAYNGIAAQGFQHDVINHQYNFVDPNTGVTTNHVKAIWLGLKQNLN